MRVRITVPATAANLGPGYDVLGLALDLCNELAVDTDEEGVRWTGEGADVLPTDGSDLVSATMRVVADRMGEALPRSGIQADNRVPLARGLGSSSAATVAGVVAASALLELGLDRESVFALAAEIEGHPDNAAPATFGGLTIAMPNGHVERLDPHPALRPVVLVPDVELPTAAARAALPDVVPMADAVVNIAHTALAVRAFTGDPTLLSQALHDRLHQGVRLSLVPDVQDVFDELQRAHVPVCVSGSGSTLLAFGEDITHDRFGVPASWRIWPLAVRATGYEVSDG